VGDAEPLAMLLAILLLEPKRLGVGELDAMVRLRA
jgi:hypothetical protein